MREMGEKVTDLFKSFHLEKITGTRKLRGHIESAGIKSA